MDDHRMQAEMAKMKQSRDSECFAARELTVAELLDRHIAKQTRLLNAFGELKNSLPASFLNSGASRIAAILEL